MIKEIKSLIDSDVTGYKIYKKTGLSQSIISELRNGKREIENLSLKTAEKLYDFYKSNEIDETYREISAYLKDYSEEVNASYGLYDSVYDYMEQNDITAEDFVNETDQLNLRFSDNEQVIICRDIDDKKTKVIYINYMSKPVDIIKELLG